MTLYDERYEYIPWGSVERKRSADFIAEAVLPPWMSVYDNDGGSANYQLGNFATSVQGLRVDTPVTTGKYALININDNSGVPAASGGTYRNDLMEIRIGLDGLTFTHDETLCDFGINILEGNSRGARVACTSAGTYFEARPGGAASRVFFPYYLLQGGEYAKPRNIEFIARPDRWVILRENGYEVAKHQFSAAEMGLGTVQPKPVLFQRGSGVIRSMFLSQLHLTFCH